ncbi:MAG TPA: VacJ family lipoprotein [Syntrophales bacterium]|nr:VacJ family lipoprotein [Syntrophales bacterium]
MKSFSLAFLLLAFVAATWPYAATAAPQSESPRASSQMQAPATTASPDAPPQAQPAPATPAAETKPAETPAAPAESQSDTNDLAGEYKEEPQAEQAPPIADPIEPFNRAMFEFNDKVYFWVLKPVAQGYKAVVPEDARVSVKNFFSNLGFPIRFVSCLLQADVECAAAEVGRFTVNTVWGIGGLMDPASTKQVDLKKQDVDLGQTLGIWGVGQGFYIVWPLIGPSSARDSIDIAGEYFLYPLSYTSEIAPWYVWPIARSYEEINRTSLRIGDYEALKSAAIDPYLAVRDAYIQYRWKKVKLRGAHIDELAPSGMRIDR